MTKDEKKNEIVIEILPEHYVHADYNDKGEIIRCYPKIVFTDTEQEDSFKYIMLGLPFIKSTGLILDFDEN